jgi:hypothetical protein
VLANGVPASAVVLSMSDTGITVNDLPMVMFDLEGRREGTVAYRVAHRESMPRLLVGAVLPGSQLPVRVDPADQGRLAMQGMTAGNGDPIVGLVLRVSGPQGTYEVRLAHRVPPHCLGLIHPGARLMVEIAPEDRQKVAIDWAPVAA